MDPEACLHLLEQATRKPQDVEAAMEHLENYINWRRGGGFQPPQGDVRALLFVRMLLPLEATREPT